MYAHAVIRSPTRVPRGSPALRTKISGTAFSRMHRPRAVAAPGAVQPLAGGKQWPAAPRPACPAAGSEFISLGVRAGALEKERIEASHPAGLDVQGFLAAQSLLPGDEGGGDAAVTCTESASWAGFRFSGSSARPAHRKP